MSGGMGTYDWLGLVVPFVVYFIMLWVWYFWEGKRETKLRERYEEEMSDG